MKLININIETNRDFSHLLETTLGHKFSYHSDILLRKLEVVKMENVFMFCDERL